MENTIPQLGSRSLASDNHSGVHPRILQSLTSINQNHCHSYEGDASTKELKKRVKEIFGLQFDSFLVFNGTAANVLAINHFMKSWGSIICTEDSHLNLDECGAPEKHIGCKLNLIRTKNGKLQAKQIEVLLIRPGDQHYSQPKMVSITQPTELGTVYSLNEIKEIAEVCKRNKLYFHIDGARLSNAVNYLDSTFKEVCQYADAVSMGGTKNGLLGCEMVLINSETPTFKFERKQLMQLPSKTRFMSQQFLTYFEQDLWKEIANHSMNLAKVLEAKISVIPEIKVLLPVESNAVFCEIPKTWIKELKKEIFFYVWEEKRSIVRLMTSFDTTVEDINLFALKANNMSVNNYKKEGLNV